MALAFCGLGCMPGKVKAGGPAPQLTPDSGVKMKIARKIWQNECAGSVKGLVAWNAGEAFPSLGIGHFIWFPSRVNERFEESFPDLVAFARQRGVRMPAIFNGAAPWRTRDELLKPDVRGGLPERMRQWLASNAALQLQGDFIIRRSMAAFGKMKRCTANPAALQRKYMSVASTPNGMYALIDYVNFKGEGINPNERYKGQGWGVLQALEEMRDVRPGQAAAVEFAEAAKRVLTRRVNNSPAARGEKRWLKGWHNRCDSYKKSL